MFRRILTLLLLALVGAVLPVAAGPAGAADDPTGDEPDAPSSGDKAYEQVVDLTFPADPRATYSDTYTAARSNDRHHRATDLMGEKLYKIYAAVGGTITWIPGAADGESMPSYGYMITIAGDDGRRYHYVHLNNDTPDTDDGKGGAKWAYAPGLKKGSTVERGQFIGYMGDSGNAESTVAHLHFEIVDPDVTDPWGTNYINPYFSLLDAEDRGDYGTDPGTHTVKARGTALACPAGDVPEDGFTDLPDGSAHEDAVDCAVWWSVARTDGELFVPGATVTRADMATFAVRLMEASDHPLYRDPGDHFTDDDGLDDEWAINQLAREGLIHGVDDDTFAPDLPVSRAQMATFLVGVVEHVARETLSGGGDHFSDDDGSPHEANIDRLANAGLATGTAPATYDPHGVVRRDQMMSFLMRSLDVLVDGGHATLPA